MDAYLWYKNVVRIQQYNRRDMASSCLKVQRCLDFNSLRKRIMFTFESEVKPHFSKEVIISPCRAQQVPHIYQPVIHLVQARHFSWWHVDL